MENHFGIKKNKRKMNNEKANKNITKYLTQSCAYQIASIITLKKVNNETKIEFNFNDIKSIINDTLKVICEFENYERLSEIELVFLEIMDYVIIILESDYFITYYIVDNGPNVENTFGFILKEKK